MKKIKIEDILCVFLILCPILDVISFLYRNYFHTSISPSTFLRPIIPVVLIIYLFFKEKIKLKIIIVGLIYLVYGVIHLLIYKNILTEGVYGSLVHEAQYIINYSYMILNLFLYWFVFKNKDTQKLKGSVVISMCIHTFLIYISIITKTSSTTYAEGLGYKGWFESGNALSAVLILSMFILLPLIKKYRMKIIILIVLIGVFLTTLIGTRVGLYGFVLSVFAYAGAYMLISLIQRTKMQTIQIIALFATIVIVIGSVIVLGSNTLKRRKYLKEIEGHIIDVDTGQVAHISTDILNIRNSSEEAAKFSMPQVTAINSLYNYANEKNISNNDRRTQQLVYHTYLLKHQKSIPLTLFGNGYLSHFAELILEMELPAFLFNFGIIGFILYMAPFLAIFIYGIIMGMKNILKLDVEYVMLLMGMFLAFALSTLSGYTFFNSSTMMIIIVLSVLLYNKSVKTKEENNLDEDIK